MIKRYLAGVIPLFAARAEGAGGQDEDLLRHRVHLANALRVAHYRQLRLADTQRYRAR
jgi:hypothetical protein